MLNKNFARSLAIHRRIPSLTVVPCGMFNSFTSAPNRLILEPPRAPVFQWPLCPAGPPAGGFSTFKKATRSTNS